MEKNKLDYIKLITKNCGSVALSSKCGKYASLTYNGVDVIAISYRGTDGYDTTEISKLSPKTIDTIYQDLKEDFD